MTTTQYVFTMEGNIFAQYNPYKYTLNSYVLSVVVNLANNVIYASDYSSKFITKPTRNVTGTLYAGITNVAGFTDGAVGTATFSGPSSMAIDSRGNLYIVDSGRIRTIDTSTNMVGTLAWSINAIPLGGPKLGSYYSEGLEIDAANNLYWLNGNMLQMGTPRGLITTIAGSATAGSTDATGAAASFNRPYALALGPDNNIYIADYGNSKIRRVSPSGAVSTIAEGVQALGLSFNGRALTVLDSTGLRTTDYLAVIVPPTTTGPGDASRDAWVAWKRVEPFPASRGGVRRRAKRRITRRKR